jgi:hypothetical protein
MQRRSLKREKFPSSIFHPRFKFQPLRRVSSSAPVSETGGPGATPGEATNFDHLILSAAATVSENPQLLIPNYESAPPRVRLVAFQIFEISATQTSGYLGRFDDA